MEEIEVSSLPVIASHSNAAALAEHPRNLPDDLIKAIAQSGGVVGAVVWAPLCRQDDVRPTLDDVLRHIDYMVDLVGPEHVGIGTDLNENFRALPISSGFEARYGSNGDGKPGGKAAKAAPGVEGFEWYHDFPNLTAALVGRGYSATDITAIMGGNFLRVAREVWI